MECIGEGEYKGSVRGGQGSTGSVGDGEYTECTERIGEQGEFRKGRQQGVFGMDGGAQGAV